MVYISLTFTRQQRNPAALDGPLEPREVLHQRKLIAEAVRALHAEPARKLHGDTGRVIRVRLHWR